MLTEKILALFITLGLCFSPAVQSLDTAAERQAMEFEEFVDEFSSDGYIDSSQVTCAVGKFGLALILGGVLGVFLLDSSSSHAHTHNHSH